MKMKRLFSLGLVLVFTGITHAADILTVKDVEVASGGRVTLNIVLANTTTNLMGWQCDVSLPQWLTLELNTDGKPKVTLGERFSTTNHSISSSCRANNTYRFIATSTEGDAIPGTSGTLFSVTLIADASLASGTKLTGKVKKIEFNTQDNQRLTFDAVTFGVNIVSSVTHEDVNGDGKVDINDALCIVNYLVGNPSAGFNAAAADVDGDGDITIADAVGVVNIILNRSGASAPKMDIKETEVVLE